MAPRLNATGAPHTIFQLYILIIGGDKMELVKKSVDRFEREYYDVEGLNELTLKRSS